MRIVNTSGRLGLEVPPGSGDVIFTGTPSGIGWARSPKVLLQPGDELITTIENIGSMRNRFMPQSTA